MNTPSKEYISVKQLAQDRKQVKGFLSAIRTQNNTINQELVGMVQKVARMREAQLGIGALIEELEERLGNK